MRPLAAAGLLLVLAGPAFADNATAQRFDAVIRIERGGTLDVAETIVLPVNASPQEVVRHLTRRRIDGIDVKEVWIGEQPGRTPAASGEATIEGRGRDEVHWHLSPSHSGPRILQVRYRVRGAVRQTKNGDVLVWRIPGQEDKLAIEAGTLEYELPAGVTGTIGVRRHRAARVVPAVDGAAARVELSGLRTNGWIETVLTMPAGSILSAPPQWQARQLRRAAYAPAWLTAAGLLFVAGLVPTFGLRQGYDAPPAAPGRIAVESVPDDLPPALAGAIVAGRPSFEHAAAALLALAGRGIVRVDVAEPGAFGSTTYRLTHVDARQSLAAYEQAVLDTAFGGQPGSPVTLSDARGRLARRFRPFSNAVREALREHGLADPDRRATRTGYLKTSGALFALAALGLLVWPTVIEDYGAWPLVVPAALASAGLVAIIFHASSTFLSNEGVERARRWKAYKQYLHKANKMGAQTGFPPDTMAYAVAFGLAAEWARHLKAHASAPPAWFHSGGQPASYAAFVAAAGAGSGSPPYRDG